MGRVFVVFRTFVPDPAFGIVDEIKAPPSSITLKKPKGFDLNVSLNAYCQG